MNGNAFQRILKFVLDQAEDQPLSIRERIYADVALICGNETEARELKSVARAIHEAGEHLAKVQLTLFTEPQTKQRTHP